MEILLAKNGGFCSGVKNAVDTAMSVSPENTYIFGEIIHNKTVVDQISKRGIKTVHDLSEVPSGARLIIRSHGVGKDVFDECKNRNIEIINCTCGFVQRTQKIVDENFRQNKTIVIIGEKTHPEVVGINGWCNNQAVVISSENDDFSVLEGKDCCIVAQTTFSKEKFEKIIKNLRNYRQKTVEVFETICYTTIGRQKEAEELSQKCDAVIVIGGENSSNTSKLYDIASKHCKNVFRVFQVDDLDYTEIKKFEKVGIVTGASTPITQTREVLLNMENETEAKTVMEEAIANMDNQPKFRKNQLIKATISSADDNGVNVLLPMAKKEVVLDKSEVDQEVYDKSAFKVGDEIELMVVSVNPVKLSQKLIKVLKEEEALLDEIRGGKEFEVVCSGFNKGGLVAAYGSYSVFIPAKEIRSGYERDLEKYVGKKLRLQVLEIRTEKRKEIIASRRVIIEAERAIREAEKAEKEAQFFASIHEGDIVEGKVERATNFGAFVSVHGFDCLAHISDLSWTGVRSVTDVLEIGKKYNFKVLKIDAAAKKVSIGYKQLQPEPWKLAEEKYAEGDVIHGKVVRIAAFGAFVEVEKGIDGLVHISQITHEFLENPTTALTIGQEVDAKIMKLDCENKKMTLSIKVLEPKPEPKRKEEDKDKSEKGEEVVEDMTEWNEGEGDISIADLLNKN